VDTQVIIAGGGPVGLMLAGELRLGGADVIVLERLTVPRAESRASTLHARTMEIFEQRGLLEPLGPVLSGPTGHFGGLPLDFSGLSTPYPGVWKVPQTRVEELLAGWAAALGADLRRGHEVRAVTLAADHVEVLTDGPRGPVPLRAHYVVGCDGEESTVRSFLGIDFPGADADLELLRADVVGIEVPDRRFERHPDGLAIASRRPDGVTRVMVHEFGRPAVARPAPPAFAEVIKAWERVTGEDISGGTPLWLNAFGNASRQAARYVSGRVLLAGDAAHVQMPVGGQALNLGLQDAVNLGWKLAAQVRGGAPDGLLESYHAERHPVGERVLGNIGAQALLLLGGQEVEAVRGVLTELIELPAVARRLAGMISGLDVSYGTDGLDPAAGLLGQRVPAWQVATVTGLVPVATALRSGRGLLLNLTERWSAAGAPWASRVEALPTAPPPDGPEHGVLVRPDGHIAWDGASGTGPEVALRRWFGEPSYRGAGAWGAGA
jgi:2-polyprenyl-6-methoxyphenol hydroxylase-like FAD-dependent oxidoreductase